MALNQLLSQDVENALWTLTEKERGVLRMRYGLDDGEEKTLEEIGVCFNVRCSARAVCCSCRHTVPAVAEVSCCKFDWIHVLCRSHVSASGRSKAKLCGSCGSLTGSRPWQSIQRLPT